LFLYKKWLVPWTLFWERILQRGWAEASEEKAVRHFLDFCQDDFVSPYELCLFLKWFGQIEAAFKTLILTLKAGYEIGLSNAFEVVIGALKLGDQLKHSPAALHVPASDISDLGFDS
jgi:hypothetical protein